LIIVILLDTNPGVQPTRIEMEITFLVAKIGVSVMTTPIALFHLDVSIIL
jgi:hypothetical protein